VQNLSEGAGARGGRRRRNPRVLVRTGGGREIGDPNRQVTAAGGHIGESDRKILGGGAASERLEEGGGLCSSVISQTDFSRSTQGTSDDKSQ